MRQPRIAHAFARLLSLEECSLRVPDAMRTFAIGLLVVLGVLTVSMADAGEPDCRFDSESMLKLDFNTFDQTQGQGWRVVAEQTGCELAAADLIRAYIDRHQTNHVVIVFYEAQLRAKAGETERAIGLFSQARLDDGKMSAFGWNEYVDATIAFLEKDRQMLLVARDRLAALEKPENFSARDRHGKPMDIEWPPNMRMVDGFVACFDKTYAVAYDTCSQ